MTSFEGGLAAMKSLEGDLTALTLRVMEGAVDGVVDDEVLALTERASVFIGGVIGVCAPDGVLGVVLNTGPRGA